jgi:hypothetical protein
MSILSKRNIFCHTSIPQRSWYWCSAKSQGETQGWNPFNKLRKVTIPFTNIGKNLKQYHRNEGLQLTAVDSCTKFENLQPDWTWTEPMLHNMDWNQYCTLRGGHAFRSWKKQQCERRGIKENKETGLGFLSFLGSFRLRTNEVFWQNRFDSPSLSPWICPGAACWCIMAFFGGVALDKNASNTADMVSTEAITHG